MKSTKEEIKKAYLFSHNQKPMTLLNYNYLDGSWQSWMYLEGLEETLQKEFTLKNKVSDIIANQILKAQNEESVFWCIFRLNGTACTLQREGCPLQTGSFK